MHQSPPKAANSREGDTIPYELGPLEIVTPGSDVVPS